MTDSSIQQAFTAAIAESKVGRLDRAEALYRQILVDHPDNAEAHFNLGNVLRRGDRVEDALAAYRRALAARPDFPEALRNLALMLRDRGCIDEAGVLFHRLAVSRPDDADAWCGLGVVSGTLQRPDEAAAAFRKVLTLRTGHADDWNNLAGALQALGLAEEAAHCYERSLAIRPDRITHSQRLVLLWLCADQDARSLLREHRDWNDRYAKPLAASIRSHDNDRNPDRRLRVGYLSPHLCQTTTAWNLLPLLRHHDREHFEVFCYSATPRRDATTDRLAASADAWRDIAMLDDDAAAEMIRNDRIDILVDLSLHLLGNRLLVFARKPAPVQVTYLGYCGTTGMDAIDYRLSDQYFDPPGTDLSVYSELTVRLPHAYWAYEPGGPLPDVTPLPALAKGHVTFASLNHFYKASAPARKLWARVLLAVPGSRLLIHAPPGSQRAKVQEEFAAAGVAPDRLQFMSTQPWPQYVATFDRIDICLDSFPHAGGIASCDGLMMGVPVVTLRGGTSVGRGGCSALSNVGLPELIADTPDDYVRIATDLAADRPRLAELRASLRQRTERSPLRDHAGFARGVEAAYRQMWKTWCRS